MSKTIYNRSNSLAVSLILCCASLTACGGMPLFQFPIVGYSTDMSESFPLPNIVRIIFSLVWYALLLGAFAIIPLYGKKCFESTQFYVTYKKFWWVASAVYLVLTSMLFSITPLTEPVIYPLMFFSVHLTVILGIAIVPAYYQHKTKNNPPN